MDPTRTGTMSRPGIGMANLLLVLGTGLIGVATVVFAAVNWDRLGASFQGFVLAYLVTDGGPQNSTLFLVLYIYRTAFQSQNMGYAATLSWLLFFILMFLSYLVFKYLGTYVYYENPGD